MDAEKRNSIHLINLFSELGDGQINEISEKCTWKRYSSGTEVLGQAEASTDIFFVVEGRVLAKKFSAEGKEVAYTEMAKGDLFGEFSAIDLKPRSASIETLEESYIARMKASEFRKLIIAYPTLGLKLAEHLVEKNRYLTGRIFEFSTMAVNHRICAELLRLVDAGSCKTNEYTILPAPSHYQIATKLSTHREAVSRELSYLSSLGILEAGRQKIKILDISRLRKMTEVEIQ